MPEEDDPNYKIPDPRQRLLSGLTQRQRYILYVILTIGVAVVLYLEVSSH